MPQRYIPRDLASRAAELADRFPVLTITGPRQSGKTTLSRSVFPNKPYVSLEDLDERAFAIEDPRGFLNRFPEGAVLDEVQRTPDLLSYLQRIVDDKGEPGLFILTGSQQLGLIGSISQTLAGRAAMLTLLPFTLGELQAEDRAPDYLNRLLLMGLYPPVHDRRLDPTVWYDSYLRTYVERDVRQIVNVQDLNAFQRFVGLCAGRIGQLLNLSSLASDCGISHPTAKSWISVLEASYVLHLLRPHHRNFNKRLIKAPKLYFHDTGLAARLLGIETETQLETHPLRGPLFENWVVSELLKRRYNAARASNLYFWRDRAGNEIDVLVDQAGKLMPIEVKAGRTVASDFAAGILRWRDLAADEAGSGSIVYGGDQTYVRSGIEYIGWRDVPKAFDLSAPV